MERNKLFLGIVILGIFLLCFSIADAEVIETCLSKDWEDGQGDWDVSNGVWQIGTPTSGPGGAHGGSQCAGTVLDDNYPANTDSRLISPSINLPDVIGEEEIHLQFWHWFSYAGNFNCDTGHIQISVQDEDTGVWSNWTSIDNIIGHTSPWSKMGVDLTAYAGNRVRIAFYHTARGDNSYPDYCGGSSTGWYIDDIEIITKVPEFTGDFESGWQDWSADRGVWQIGTPTAGPEECHSGLQCAGTVLDGNYPANTDSRLISPSINLPDDEEIYLRFWHWFSYAGGGHCDVGYIQVSVWDEGTGEWSNWTNIGNPVTDSSPWSRRREDLTTYAGRKVRIAFYHTARGDNSYPHYCGASSSGWYIDDIRLPGVFLIPCEGDFDNDGDVDGSDLSVFAADFGRTDCSLQNFCDGDFDGDGDVDGSDLAILAADFGKTDCFN